MRALQQLRAIPFLICAAVFVADLFFPENYGIPTLYITAAAFAMRRRESIRTTLVVSVLLTALGLAVKAPSFQAVLQLVLSPEHIVSRALAIVAVLSTGYIAASMNTALRASKEDQLTQVYNRRGLEAALATRNKLPATAILVDLDDFKRINDTWGLLVGDTVLREVADMLTSVARTTDIVCRYGGDEFLMLLDCPLPQARKISERVFRLLSNARIELNSDGAYVRITASLGVAPLDANTTVAEVVRRTQFALRKSKKAGKNRITFLDIEDALEEDEVTNILRIENLKH